jgi:hypothetical protein
MFPHQIRGALLRCTLGMWASKQSEQQFEFRVPDAVQRETLLRRAGTYPRE